MTDSVQAQADVQPVDETPKVDNGFYVIRRVRPDGIKVVTVGQRNDGDEPEYPWMIVGRVLQYSDKSFLKRWEIVSKIEVPTE